MGLVGAVAAIGSCQSDQWSIAGPLHRARPVAVIASPSTVTVYPTADTRIGLDPVNHTDSLLTVYTWPDDTVANAILMQFALGSIPPGSTISSATLNVYLRTSDTTTDSLYTVTAHGIVHHNPDLARATGYTYDGVNSWTSNACCRGGVPLAQADTGPRVDAQSVDKTGGFKQWNVTALAQGWFANPSTNFGLLLNSDPSKLADRYRYFASSRDTTHRPYLTVTYSSSSFGVPDLLNNASFETGWDGFINWSFGTPSPAIGPFSISRSQDVAYDGVWSAKSTFGPNGTDTHVQFAYPFGDHLDVFASRLRDSTACREACIWQVAPGASRGAMSVLLPTATWIWV
jgi:hypothetical protein